MQSYRRDGSATSDSATHERNSNTQIAKVIAMRKRRGKNCAVGTAPTAYVHRRALGRARYALGRH